MTPPPLSLSQLEAALNPGIGDGLLQAVNLDGFGGGPDVGSELTIFELRDLDRQPRRLTTVQPQFPADFQVRGLRGEVRVRILIDEQGNVSILEVVGSTHPEAVQPVRQALVRWRFEPPMRNGQPVRAQYIQPIGYNFSQ
ncbi:MAG: energy transducer TonB [Verrucomicrobia bacterium]|nr:energy transducer TonB [Verrucomicrobiota bacterium]